MCSWLSFSPVQNILLPTNKMASFGKLAEFDMEETDWKSYGEQLNFLLQIILLIR